MRLLENLFPPLLGLIMTILTNKQDNSKIKRKTGQ